MNESKELGRVLRRLRTSTGRNQREFAELLDIDSTYLSHLESGRRDPSVQLLRRIAREGGVPPGVLLAAALSSDLPPQYQSQYRQIVDSLLDLSAVAQLQLGLNPDIDETGDATSTASDHNT